MPFANILIDIFGLIVNLIIFFSCLEERVKKETKSSTFLFLMGSITLALIGDIVRWVGEGNVSLSSMTLVGSTVAACSGYLSVFFFIIYLGQNLFIRSRAVIALTVLIGIMCLASIVFMSADVLIELDYHIDNEGHFVHGEDPGMMLTHFAFPIFAFVISAMMILTARFIDLRQKIFYMFYAVFPLIGVVVDYCFHGWSFTYIGLVIGILIIYTNIYLQKRRLIQEQRTALMMSQINPHFMYNTLTTVAYLCETDPKKAKELTIEFSSFLRHNLNTIGETHLIPFEQELRHIGCYLKIEKARFHDRVHVVYAIHEKKFMVPALSVQPLVENAIKHGITKRPEGGTVKITSYKTEKDYVIEIKDDGVGFDVNSKKDDGRDHVGLENVKNRLKQMCGGALTVKSLDGVGTRIIITIPQKKAKMSENDSMRKES